MDEELRQIANRVINALKSLDGDARWDPEIDCIVFYDVKTEHDIAVTIDWA